MSFSFFDLSLHTQSLTSDFFCDTPNLFPFSPPPQPFERLYSAGLSHPFIFISSPLGIAGFGARFLRRADTSSMTCAPLTQFFFLRFNRLWTLLPLYFAPSPAAVILPLSSLIFLDSNGPSNGHGCRFPGCVQPI